jgi:hypothetical protein
MRLSAGNGKQLASRLVDASLWDETPGGWRFHDFDHIYTPEDLATKRAEAGRKGGLASGRTRQTGGQGTKNEASTKQLASSDEAKQAEASHTRAGATTHYPDASKEASSASVPKRGTRISDDFAATAEMVEWARTHAADVDGRSQTERFVDYWRAQPGAKGVKTDWPATWRNWMRKAQDDAQPANGHRTPTGRPLLPASSAPTAIPAAERCPDHRGEIKGECRHCRAIAIGRKEH